MTTEQYINWRLAVKNQQFKKTLQFFTPFDSAGEVIDHVLVTFALPIILCACELVLISLAIISLLSAIAYFCANEPHDAHDSGVVLGVSLLEMIGVALISAIGPVVLLLSMLFRTGSTIAKPSLGDEFCTASQTLPNQVAI